MGCVGRNVVWLMYMSPVIFTVFVDFMFEREEEMLVDSLNVTLLCKIFEFVRPSAVTTTTLRYLFEDLLGGAEYRVGKY